MDKEAVKKIVDEPVNCADGQSHYMDESQRRNLTSRICRIFPKTEDNSDGFEEKPLIHTDYKKEMPSIHTNYDEPKPDETTKIKCSRCDNPAEWIFGKYADNFCQEHWEEYCGEQWAKTHWGTIEPDPNRLLLDEEIVNEIYKGLDCDAMTQSIISKIIDDTAKAQDAKTASIKDQAYKVRIRKMAEHIAKRTGQLIQAKIESQARVEGIKRKIENSLIPTSARIHTIPNFYIRETSLKAIWKEERIE